MGEKRFDKVVRVINGLVKVMFWISAVVLILGILLVVTNVLGRSVFKKPVPGTIELVEMLAVDMSQVVSANPNKAFSPPRRAGLVAHIGPALFAFLPLRTKSSCGFLEPISRTGGGYFAVLICAPPCRARCRSV